MRDRAKSMEGVLLKSSTTNQQQHSRNLQHEQSVMSSRYRPPLDYNIFNWLAAKLNKTRRKMKAHENRYWIKAKMMAKKIVESV